MDKKRNLRQDRKGMDLESLVGIILGVVLLLGFLLLLSNCSMRSSGQRSFDEFSQNVIAMAAASRGESDSFILDLDGKTAVIGFNPESTSPNGRFGDGDVQYLMSDRAKACATCAEDRLVYVPRPQECPADKGCLCRCVEPYFYAFDQSTINAHIPAYLNFPATDYAKADVPYLRPSLSIVAGLFNHEVVPRVSSVNPSSFITCKKVSCVPVEGSFPAVSLQPLFTDGQGYSDPGYDATNPFFAFEDGFIIFNIGGGDGPGGHSTYQNRNPAFGYTEDIASVALKVAKLQDGTVGVCITQDCVDILEKNVKADKDHLAKLAAAQAPAVTPQPVPPLPATS